MKKIKVIVVLVVLGLTLLLTGCVDDMATVNLLPDSDGSVQQWDASLGPDRFHWERVDDDPSFPPDEDITYVYTNVINEMEEFNHTTSDLLAGATITKVRVTVRAKTTSVYLVTMNIGVRVGLMRYGAASDEVLTTSYANYYKEWTNNPADSQPWEKSDIDALQSSLLAKTHVFVVRATQVYLTVTYAPLTPVAGKGLVSWTP